ncbi:hypothetical protein F442_19367, partial [Phytophthora nicotianae P10297]
MRHVASKVGSRISTDMGNQFGLMFDGWTSGIYHFIAIYAVFTKEGALHEVLLAMSPAENGQTADAHIGMIDAVLDLYKKEPSMVLFLVADNCSTNRTVATRMGVPLVGHCAFQLRYTNNEAKLAQLTKYKPLKANATRWSSTYQMLVRYVKIRDAIKMVAVEDLLPRPSTHRQIVQLVTKLEVLDSFPATAHHLSPSAQIVHSPAFESAVVKLLSNRSLISDEEEAVAQFAGPTDSAQETPKKVAFATETLRHAKRPRLATVTKYIDLLRMIPPTSNKCEPLFHHAWRAVAYMQFLEEHKPKMNRERIILIDETVVYCEDARAYTVDDVGARHVVVRSTGFASLRITVMAVTATGKKLPPCLIWKRKNRSSNERLGGCYIGYQP